MGLNRKKRIRARKRSWAFVFERKDLYLRMIQGDDTDLIHAGSCTLEQAQTFNLPLLKDNTGRVIPSGAHIKEPVTAVLSWITPQIQHSANRRRDKERISTFRRNVYGAPLRTLHNSKAYNAHFRGEEVLQDITKLGKVVTFA